MKVNFLVVGAQRSGTTALYRFLKQHPSICMSNTKEVHFFDNDNIFSSRCNYSIYHDHFININRKSMFGEVTPIYMYWKTAPARIKAYNPEMKLIFILKNPADRAYSHYWLARRNRKESLPFFLAIRLEKLRAFKQDRVHSYIDRGFYSVQIERMRRYFPMQQMLFLKNEELIYNHHDSMRRIFNFLGIQYSAIIQPKLINMHIYKSMKVMDKKFLLEKFQDDLCKLEQLFGWNCSKWKE